MRTTTKKASPNRRKRSKSPDPLFQTIAELAVSINQLAAQAAREYAPIVDTILRSQSRCTDARHI